MPLPLLLFGWVCGWCGGCAMLMVGALACRCRDAVAGCAPLMHVQATWLFPPG